MRHDYYGDDDDDGARDGEEIMECETNDAAFILGKGGSTKHKIAKVCGADIELDEALGMPSAAALQVRP